MIKEFRDFIAKGNVIEKPELLENNLVEVFKDGEAYRGAFANVKPRTFHGDVRKIVEGTGD